MKLRKLKRARKSDRKFQATAGCLCSEASVTAAMFRDAIWLYFKQEVCAYPLSNISHAYNARTFKTSVKYFMNKHKYNFSTPRAVSNDNSEQHSNIFGHLPCLNYHHHSPITDLHERRSQQVLQKRRYTHPLNYTASHPRRSQSYKRCPTRNVPKLM